MILAALVAGLVSFSSVQAEDMSAEILKRLEQLEQENRALKQEYKKLKELVEKNQMAQSEKAEAKAPKAKSSGNILNFDHQYGLYRHQDHTSVIQVVSTSFSHFPMHQPTPLFSLLGP